MHTSKHGNFVVLGFIVLCCLIPAYSFKSEETISSVVAWKMRWVHELMETDWLTEVMRLRDQGGGFDKALMDGKFILAHVRGHPTEVLEGKSGEALRSALMWDAVADALVDTLREAIVVAAKGDEREGWISLRPRATDIEEQLRTCVSAIDSLELQQDRVRIHPTNLEKARHMYAVLGILRNHFWPWKRIPAIWVAARTCSNPWFITVFLEATLGLAVDLATWILALLLPFLGPVIGFLHLVAKGQSASFRGLLIVLPTLLFLYMVLSLFIEAVFMTFGIIYGLVRALFSALAGKVKTS